MAGAPAFFCWFCLLTSSRRSWKEAAEMCLDLRLDFQQKWFNLNRSAGCKYSVATAVSSGKGVKQESLRINSFTPGSDNKTKDHEQTAICI